MNEFADLGVWSSQYVHLDTSPLRDPCPIHHLKENLLSLPGITRAGSMGMISARNVDNSRSGTPNRVSKAKVIFAPDFPNCHALNLLGTYFFHRCDGLHQTIPDLGPLHDAVGKLQIVEVLAVQGKKSFPVVGIFPQWIGFPGNIGLT